MLGAHKHLAVGQVLHILEALALIGDLTDGAVAAGGKNDRLSLALRLPAGDGAEAGLVHEFEWPGWVLLVLGWVETPDVDLGVLTARHEACVVVEPGDTLHWLGVHRKLEVLSDGGGVELVYPDLLVVLAGEEMTTVGEHNLTALLDRQLLVLDKGTVQNVHHANLVAEADHDVESTGVERQRMRLKVALVAEFRLEHVAGSVGPQPDGTIRRAGSHEFLFDADVEAVDLLGVEG